MNRYRKVKNNEKLVRDTHSGAIINTDSRALEQARRFKAERIRDKKETLQLREMVDHLEKEVKKIKDCMNANDLIGG